MEEGRDEFLENIELIKIVDADWLNLSMSLDSKLPFLRTCVNRMSADVPSWILIPVTKQYAPFTK